MKIFLHKLTVSCMFCTMVVCFALAGCQDVVRRVDDKYRPVKEPGSVTVLADRADDLGVPIQIKNLSVDELELKVSSSDNSPVPFVPILEEGVQAGFGRITITPPSSDEPFGNFTAVIDVCSKETGEVYDSYEYTADRYPYRIYQVGNETYKFELVKMFHFEQNRGNFGAAVGGGDGIVSLFTGNNDENKDVNEKGSTVTIKDTNTDSQKGTGLTFYYNTSDTGQFKQDQYNYVEIKFKSGETQTPEFALFGEAAGGGKFGFWYDGGCIGAGEGIQVSGFRVNDFSSLLPAHSSSSIDLTYDDSSTDWCVIGFHNRKDGKCLFTENLENATEKTLSSTKDFDFTKDYTVFYVGPGSTLEIDYIAFFKRVEQ